MSMTMDQVRAARREAEERIGSILLQLAKDTGLGVRDVRLQTTVIGFIHRDRDEIVDIRVTLRMEAP